MGANKELKGKPEYAVLPWDAIEEVVRVFEYGAKKYKAPFTYRSGVAFSNLASAAFRHLVLWFFFREDHDKESGCLHLAHVAANVMMIISMINFNWRSLEFDDYDDRPTRGDKPLDF